MTAKGLSSGPWGLTPDAVKFDPAYRDAVRSYVTAFHRLRTFNAWFVKAYAAQCRAERRAKAESRTKD